MENHPQKSKEIISQSLYTTIATVTNDGKPWNTPVIFVADDQLNVYWTSFAQAVHSQNLEINPHAFLVFYNSEAASEVNDGVYMAGKVQMLKDETELLQAATLLYGKKQKPVPEASTFLGDSPKKLYKFTPSECWINPGTGRNKNLADPRIKVELV